jgi:hypothetical protein
VTAAQTSGIPSVRPSMLQVLVERSPSLSISLSDGGIVILFRKLRGDSHPDKRLHDRFDQLAEDFVSFISESSYMCMALTVLYAGPPGQLRLTAIS